MNQSNQPVTKKCPHCGAEIKASLLRCNVCGEKDESMNDYLDFSQYKIPDYIDEKHKETLSDWKKRARKADLIGGFVALLIGTIVKIMLLNKMELIPKYIIYFVVAMAAYTGYYFIWHKLNPKP